MSTETKTTTEHKRT